jgi:hypothetical protein
VLRVDRGRSRGCNGGGLAHSPPPGDAMDFPFSDLLEEGACYQRLVAILHPGGLACPRCGARAGLGVHRRHRAPALDYPCGACGRVFSAFTGTALQKPRRPCAPWLPIRRGLCQGVPTARRARELGGRSGGVSKDHLDQYVAMFQWAYNLKEVTNAFLRMLLGGSTAAAP